MIVLIAFCGSIFAQYESPWYFAGYPHWETNTGICAAVAINGHVYTVDDEGWDALEIGYFVGDECRGNNVYLDRANVDDFGDPYPIIPGTGIAFTNPGELVTFKLYDHINNIEYSVCDAVTYLDEPFEVLTGPDYFQAWLDEPYLPIILWFSGEVPTPPTTFTKEITGYGEQSNPGGYYLIASPVQETLAPTDVNHMMDNEFDLYYFNQDVEDNLPWINYKVDEAGTEYDPEFTIVPGKGYLYANSEDVVLEFTGTPYEGDGVVNLDYVAEKPYTGWNLIGNPFADTAYLFYEMAEDEWFWYDFYILDGSAFRLAEDEESFVEPMSGILVEATEEVQAVRFEIDGKAKRRALNMTLTRNSGNVMDVARLRFDNGRGLHKFQLNPGSTKIYFTMDNEDYAVANAPEMGEMPVSFKAESNGTYTLNFTSKEVSFNYLHLIDNMTGADVDLLVNPSYTFDASTTDYASRFKLVFATGSNSDDSFAFFSNGGFVISNEGEAMLQVVDVTGRILKSETINGSANVHVDAAPGVYMLRLINGDNVKVQKVVVR